MAVRGKKAWLITWDNMGSEHWGGEHNKIVAVLPPRLALERVKEIVVALWCTHSLDLPDRIFYGLNKDQQEKQFKKIESDRFYFGFKPFLNARKVTNLRWTEKDGKVTARWLEAPHLKLDPHTFATIVVRPPFENEWSEAVWPLESTKDN